MNRPSSLLLFASLVLTALAVAGGLQACSSPTTPCDGCTTADGTCAKGTEGSACGIGGAECRVCAQLETCNLGVCIPPGGGGGNDSGTAMDAGGVDAGTMDAGTDAGMSPDAGTDAGMSLDAGTEDAGTMGIMCGASVCMGADQCCGDFTDAGVVFSCAATCGDAGINISCDGPEDCEMASPTCCGELITGPGQPPNCPAKSVTAVCSATCSPNVPLSCNATAEIVRCHQRSECAAFGMYSECCTFPAAGTSAGYFCSTTFMQQFATDCAP